MGLVGMLSWVETCVITIIYIVQGVNLFLNFCFVLFCFFWVLLF
jgi:hypothetical protein